MDEKEERSDEDGNQNGNEDGQVKVRMPASAEGPTGDGGENEEQC